MHIKNLYVLMLFAHPLRSRTTTMRGLRLLERLAKVSVSFFLLSLIQIWNFLNAPLGSTVAFTASICLHPRPLRACAEPQAGVIPPRRSFLVYTCVYICPRQEALQLMSLLLSWLLVLCSHQLIAKIQSVVTGQAPITLEVEQFLRKKNEA